jgi:ATP-dependent exoDNAse (exonuclease V) alpha subunit
MTQDQALSVLKTGVNMFLTGEPGSGKTFTINTFIKYLRSHKINVSVTASTGIAATHINGRTIHSWSGIGIKKELNSQDISIICSNDQLVSRVTKTKVLIIDEISMLDGKVLSAINSALKAIRKNNEPFGGLQIVFVGDFFQLPPVTRNGETLSFAFESPAWQEANPTVCYLSEQHRQTDSSFLSFLGAIRRGVGADSDYSSLLQENINPSPHIPRLYPHNIDVDALNNKKLSIIVEDEYIFQMTSVGKKALVDQLKKGCLSPEILNLKKGARVMFTKNNFEQGYVNGTLGEVVGFSDDGFPQVLTTQGKEIEVDEMEWTVEDGDKILASISQIPLRLAWAITVHKSQGLTMDAAVMDLSRAFEYGQGYVAISRVRSFSGLYILGLNKRALEVHPKILEIDNVFRKTSLDLENKLNIMAMSKLKKRIKEKSYSVEAVRGLHEQTRDLTVGVSTHFGLRPFGKHRRSDDHGFCSDKNAYRAWSADEERELIKRHKNGEGVSLLSKIFGRQIGSIRARLIKLGII